MNLWILEAVEKNAGDKLFDGNLQVFLEPHGTSLFECLSCSCFTIRESGLLKQRLGYFGMVSLMNNTYSNLNMHV